MLIKNMRLERNKFIPFHNKKEKNKDFYLVCTTKKNELYFEALSHRLMNILDVDINIINSVPRNCLASISTTTILLRESTLCIFDGQFLIEEFNKWDFIDDFGPKLLNQNGTYIILCNNENEVKIIEEKLLICTNKMFEIDRDRVFINEKYTSIPINDIADIIIRSLKKHFKTKVFLSHASEDTEFSERLANKLSTKGIPVWFDRWSLKVGDSIVEKINEGLYESNYLAVILSKSSVTKPWCKREIESALHRQLHDNSIKLLPILIEDCNIPLLISDILWADFRHSFDTGFEQIIYAISDHD